MDHEVEVRQIEPARRDIGRDADLGAAFAQRAQGGVALGLGEFAGKGDGVKAAGQQAGMQVADGIARGAKHQARGSRAGAAG